MPAPALPRAFVPLAAALALSACMSGADHTRPVVAGESGNWIAPADGGPVDTAWWRALGDAELVRLIDLAVANNLDLRAAEARLRAARADRDAAAGRALPQLDANGSATANRLSRNGQIPIGDIPGFDRNFNLFDAGFDASWEIDLWGRTARAVDAAQARAEAAEATRHDVLMQVIAEVATNYADLRAAQARIVSARADADAQARIAGLTEQRYRAGEAARFDFVRADAQARTTRAAIAGLDADATAAINRLALLAGNPPEALAATLREPAAMPTAPATLAVGLRSEILRRRPDIRIAERTLAAATADARVAVADQFPRLTLMGSIGQQGRDGGDLSSGGSTRFSVGPSLRWPIFAGGTIRAQIRGADARADAAAADYEKAVLGAFADSETALNRFAAARIVRGDRDAARDRTAEALDLARQRYRAGEDDLLVLLDAQSAFSTAEAAAIDARTAELRAFIAVYKALGGGWEAFPADTGAQPTAR